ncbi:hypothetical protein PV08_00008 [Exophiala spinifera]|uniref:Major facilitator superfamily (MFS) profile domain-containing protein n=1 Tax=Exophiala spinifera TaxID=91928 RepID=A0A0D1YVY9_9EURO|nr:uncharacterized protein PV08_00008 [Exophiala spinifera]KIW19436.1 hypothetical protein PV08_00008 [Exophiala spinifera]
MAEREMKPERAQLELSVDVVDKFEGDAHQGKVADTVHNDEATKIFATYEGDQNWTQDEEKRLVRKIDRRLLVILTITFAIQFYDKYMLSHAAIFGLIADLKLTGNRYSWSASIFYLGYIVGVYPQVLLAQRFKVHIVITAIVFVWGLCVLSTALCTTYKGLYTQRFFLGLLESGVSPIWMTVVGSWYKKSEQSFRQGLWFSAAAMVAIPAPLINYGFGKTHGSLSPWRYMYIFAGSLTTVWSFQIFFFMEPDPVHAKRLSEREKFIAVSRLRSNNTGVKNTHFKSWQVRELLCGAQFWLLFFIALLMNTASSVSTVFLPILIRAMGFTSLNALLLTIPIGVVGTITTLGLTATLGFLASRNLRLRALTVCAIFMLLAVLLVWQLPLSDRGGRLFALYWINWFPAAYSILMNVAMINTAGYTKRTLTSAGMFVGYCIGNFVTPFTFLTEEAPRYDTGCTFVTVCQAVMVVLILAYYYLCVHTNAKRDAAGFTEGFEHAFEDDMTDQINPRFRFGGVCADIPSLEYTENTWAANNSVNIDGVMWTAQAAGKIFQRQRSGNFIITASVSATLVNVPQRQAAYNASKAAAVHLGKSLAVEWVQFGARVNMISPGFIETEMVLSQTKERFDDWIRMIPARRMAKASELQAAYIFLASDA